MSRYRNKFYNIIMIKIKLYELMGENDVTTKEIAKATGLSTTTLTNIKRKRYTNVELDTIDKLCNFFDCKIEDLLEFKKN